MASQEGLRQSSLSHSAFQKRTESQSADYEESLKQWLTLSLVPGMSSRQFNFLLDRFGSPQAILNTRKQSLIQAGLNQQIASTIFQHGLRFGKTLDDKIAGALRWLEGKHHKLLTRFSTDYPEFLSRIPDPPPVLYLKGDPSLLHRPQLAMIGSRNPSGGGRRNARMFASELARAGLTITSGLAMGIDAESHKGALGHLGSTIAVLGTGIDRIYPAMHKEIFHHVAEQGLLVSEFPLGTPPLKMNFPRRNRIISGLSMGVLVVEAGLKSGSMITARYALEQGREVYAIPGSIHNPVARGCHKLISEGARLVEKAGDIFEECGSLLETVMQQTTETSQSEKNLDPVMQQILSLMGYDLVQPDQVILETGLASEQVIAALSNLELQGLIQREGSGYILTRA